MKLYLQLSDVGSGEIELHERDPKAAAVEEGRYIRFGYRGADRGGFIVENISTSPSVSSDEAGRVIDISGRGPMAILDDGIIRPVDLAQSIRSFVNMSKAGIFIQLFEEAQSRGCFPHLSWDFTEEHDSQGQNWDDILSIDLRVGMSLLDLMREFASVGIEFTITPDFKLRAFRQIGTDKSAGVIFRIGQNCVEIQKTSETSGIKNALLVEQQGANYFALRDAASEGIHRRREAMFSAGQAPDVTTAQRLAEASLAEQKDPKLSIKLKAIDADGVMPRVFVDYGLGDWVGVDFGTGEVTPYRIRALTLDDIQPGSATIILELNSSKVEMEIRTAQGLKRLQSAMGIGAGGIATQSPQDPSAAISRHNGDAKAHPNMVHDATKVCGKSIAQEFENPGDGDTWRFVEDETGGHWQLVASNAHDHTRSQISDLKEAPIEIEHQTGSEPALKATGVTLAAGKVETDEFLKVEINGAARYIQLYADA